MNTLALLALLASPVQDEKDENLEALRAVWTAILEQANADKVEDLQKTISGWKITKEEFTALFGEEKTTLAYAKYEKFWKDVNQEAAKDIVKRQQSNKYDTIDVWCVNNADPKTLSGNEKSALDSLVDKKVKFYSVRLRTRDAKDGFTLVCFTKVGDNWRALFKGGRYLKAEK